MKAIKRILFFLIVVELSIIMMILQGCTKREEQPEQVVFWENSTNDTIHVLINGVKNAGVGLFPHQSRLRGDASWVGKTYILPGTSECVTITLRNTITSKGY